MPSIMPISATLRLAVASAAACFLASCATGPRYQAATGNTGTIYGNTVNPATVLTGKELHTAIVSIDGVSSGGGRSYTVDAGKHSIEVRGVGAGGFSVWGTVPLTVAKDQYYYFRCIREGSYRFICEIEDDSGMKTVASAAARSQR
jgi:plastocyanin